MQEGPPGPRCGHAVFWKAGVAGLLDCAGPAVPRLATRMKRERQDSRQICVMQACPLKLWLPPQL